MKFSDQRKIMIEEQLIARDIIDENVLEAFAKIPRGDFVAENIKYLAYSDTPLTIGENQTISQPYIVAKMMQLLEINQDCEILEIGTGSGYQTALFAEIAEEIFTVERIKILSSRAKRVLGKLGYSNINFSVHDGTLGWTEEELKFDRIIVSAGAPDIPDSLMQQLRPGGIIIIPTGDNKQQQLHKVIEKDGDYIHTMHDLCTFVPLMGKLGWK